MSTLADRLDGRYGFPEGCSEWSRSDWAVYAFNRTVLGLAFLLGLYHLSNVDWSQPLAGEPWWAFVGTTPLGSALLIFGVFFPVYFWLHKRVDAPGEP